MPDAPKPLYNSHGMLQREWLLVVSFRPDRECYTLSWTKDGDRYHPTEQGAIAYPVSELQDLVEGVTSQLQVLGAPQLF